MMGRPKKVTKGELVPVKISEIERIFGTINLEKRVALAEEIGSAKLSGKKTTELAIKYNTSTSVVHDMYHKFLEMNKVDWLKQRGATVAEINMRYQKKMQDAEANYRVCQDMEAQQGMALWTKIMCDVMKNYVEFLQKIGYITEATSIEIDDSVKKEEKEPILLIVNQYRQYITEKAKEEKK